MKSILVPAIRIDAFESQLATAWAIASRFDSYIEAIFVPPVVLEVIAGDRLGATVAVEKSIDKAHEEDARSAFHNFLRSKRWPQAEIAKDGWPSARWNDTTCVLDNLGPF